MKLRKPCQLVILKRSPANPDTCSAPTMYWAGLGLLTQWVEVQSSAQLLNRSDAKRDLVENEQFTTDDRNRISDGTDFVDTKFELVELVEKSTVQKQSFGFIVKMKGLPQAFPEFDPIDSYVSVCPAAGYVFQTERKNASILSLEEKDHIIEKVREDQPDREIIEIELFA